MNNKITGMMICTGLLFFSVHGMGKLPSFRWKEVTLPQVPGTIKEALNTGKEKEAAEHINKYLDTKGDPNAYVLEATAFQGYDDSRRMVYQASFIHAEPLLCRVIHSVANAGHRESLIRRLVTTKANVNATDRNGKTVLELVEARLAGRLGNRTSSESQLIKFLKESCAAQDRASAKDSTTDKV